MLLGLNLHGVRHKSEDGIGSVVSRVAAGAGCQVHLSQLTSTSIMSTFLVQIAGNR